MSDVEVGKKSQSRPQGLLLCDFQTGVSSGRAAIFKIAEEKALGTRLEEEKGDTLWHTYISKIS